MRSKVAKAPIDADWGQLLDKSETRIDSFKK